jgi:hypothetical protein
VVEGYFYPHGSPLADQLGPESALAVTCSRLDDDDLMVCAALRETWPGDVVRREATHFGPYLCLVKCTSANGTGLHTRPEDY